MLGKGEESEKKGRLNKRWIDLVKKASGFSLQDLNMTF